MFDVAVIGEGIAGLAAARAVAESGARAGTFEALLFGGLVTNVTLLDPQPEAGPSSGADLASAMAQVNAELGIHSIQQAVISLARDGAGFVLSTAQGEYRAGRVVVASGARLRTLGIPGEAEFVGRGVSSCADCDGPLYRGHDVVVAGGGDSALQEALVLAEFCRQVHVISHSPRLTGRIDLVERITSRGNIAVLCGAELVRIDGDRSVEGVAVRRHDSSTFELPCAGVFAYVGLVPNSEYLPGEARRDVLGHVLTDATLETSLRGVFAAGAVRGGYGGTLADALREGTAAGKSAVSLPRG
jgi:thioredoxin reductase (NADPH)